MSGRITSVLASVLWIVSASGLLFAQEQQAEHDPMDMSLEQLMRLDIDSVYGASGFKQEVSNVPASITIVTAEEIKRHGYRTLSDILRNIPGMYVTSDRDTSYIGMRGFGRPGDYNTRILTLVDGHRMISPTEGAVVYGMDFPIDIDLIERVEVIRGPNSSIYIAGALLGVINVVTKRGSDVGLNVSQELASYLGTKSRLSYGHRFSNGLEMLLSGSYYRSPGPDKLYFSEFDTPFTNHGIAEKADRADAYQEFGRVSFRGLTLQGAYGASDQKDPTASYSSIFNDPHEHLRIMAGYLDLSYEHAFGGNWGYLARVFYDNDGYHGTFPIDLSSSGLPARVLDEDFHQGQAAGVSVAISKKLSLGQTLVAGGEWRDDFEQTQSNHFADPLILNFASHEASKLWGLHLQDEIPLRENLVLDLGLSFDHYSTFGGTVNPRSALIYQPFERTSLKLLFGQSFRAPTAFEMYNFGTGQQPNARLQPEKARTTELVWEQRLKHNFRLTSSGYYYPIRGVISAAADPLTGLFMYQNRDRIDLRGVETALQKQSRYGWEAGLSINVQRARSLDTPGPLSNSPRFITQASFSMPLLKRRLYASADMQYVSQRRTLEGDTAGSYWLPNLTLYSPNARHNWEFSASFYNVFDQLYADPASVAHVEHVLYQNGRNFRLKFTHRF